MSRDAPKPRRRPARPWASGVAFALWSILLPVASHATSRLRDAAAPYPVVLWHGMGDTCCNDDSIGYIKNYIFKHYGSETFVMSLNTGNAKEPSDWEDFLSGFYGNVNDQIAQVCQKLQVQPELRDGFNLIGFSQGGQFARAVVQRCRHEGVKVKTLITFGAQHQGVVDVPGCTIKDKAPRRFFLCRAAMYALGTGAYSPYVRNHIVQAQYFKDPYELVSYYKYNPFLPDVNNEIAAARKDHYRENLAALDRFIMVRFADDFTVVPRDSAWFSWFNGTALIPLREQTLYKEDWLGLQQLDARGLLIFEEMPGFHMQIDLQIFIDMLEKYLSRPQNGWRDV